MGDFNHDVYATHSHRELYDQLMAGKPDQIDGHAAALRRLHDTVAGLSSTLATDLTELGASWSSSSGQEYTHRLGTIVSFSGQLGDDLLALGTHLTSMAADLRKAQKDAESPDKIDGNANMKEDAAIGGAVFGVPGAVIGGIWGHNKDEEAKQKAHEQMVNVVAKLAGQYQLRDEMWPTPPADPAGLPGDSTGGHASPHAGAGGAGARGYDGPHSGGGVLTAQPGSSAGGGVTAVGDTGPSGSGTSLAGAGGAVIGTGLLSLAALDNFRGGTPVGGGNRGGTGLDHASGPGVIGGDEGDAHRSGTGVQGARGGRSGTGVPGENDAAARGNRAATGSGNANRAAMTGRGEHAEDEPNEHLTWLVEDEMVWGGDAAAPPAVLGVETPTTEPEAGSEPQP